MQDSSDFAQNSKSQKKKKFSSKLVKLVKSCING
jgi:hypothetical protein